MKNPAQTSVLERSLCVFQVDRSVVNQEAGPVGLRGRSAGWEETQVLLRSPSVRKAVGPLKLGGHLG